MTINVTQFSLADLMPHAAPMILLNRLLEVDEECAICEVVIHDKSMFLDHKKNGVPAWVGIEYMAQSIAVHAGVQSRLAEKQVNIGLLLGSRRYESEVIVFELDDVLKIKVQRLYQEDNGLGGFECEIYRADEVICRAKLNVFSPQDSSQFFD